MKDLADLVLFLDIGLEPREWLVRVVDDVFTAHGADGFPEEIPDPPADWEARYAELATELRLSAPTLDAAMTSLRSFWNRALATRQEQ